MQHSMPNRRQFNNMEHLIKLVLANSANETSAWPTELLVTVSSYNRSGYLPIRKLCRPARDWILCCQTRLRSSQNLSSVPVHLLIRTVQLASVTLVNNNSYDNMSQW